MCGLSAATVGLITNVAGLFFTPMADEFGVLRGSASLTLTIANTCVALGGIATRRMTKLMPLRALLIVGTAIMAGSTFATAVAPSIGVAYLLSITKGLAGGVIGFVLITYVLNKWFVSQLGLATSIAMASVASPAPFSRRSSSRSSPAWAGVPA
jgi:predicted MFS family arabinose efflux permease